MLRHHPGFFLVWEGEEVGLGWGREGVKRKQENKTRLFVSIIDESTTAYESIFDSNELQSVYLRGKSAPI